MYEIEYAEQGSEEQTLLLSQGWKPFGITVETVLPSGSPDNPFSDESFGDESYDAVFYHFMREVPQ